LHVDDSQNDRNLVKEAIVLTNTPFAVFEADGMESAMAYFTQHLQPALVLLDYDMGQHTGADFLHWLRTVKKQVSTPIVMFSGSVGDSHVEECYGFGADYFIRKPKEFARFKAIVCALHASLANHQPDPIFQLQEYRPHPSAHAETWCAAACALPTANESMSAGGNCQSTLKAIGDC